MTLAEPAVPARAASPLRAPRWRPVLCLVLAAAAAVVAWLMARAGVTVNEFPPFLPDGVPTEITHYSGPWLAAAGGAMLVAAVLLVLAGTDLLRGRAAPSAAADGQGTPATPGTLAG